jgi:hypothetical protein
MDYSKAAEDKCEEDCVASGRSAPAFWGVIILLIGLLILVEAIKSIVGDDLPQWFRDISLWWVIGLVIAIGIIVAGVRMVTRND